MKTKIGFNDLEDESKVIVACGVILAVTLTIIFISLGTGVFLILNSK